MDVEGWRRVQDLFAGAVELPPEQREAFLVEETGGDRDLIREVLTLLAADEAARRFLEGGALRDVDVAEPVTNPLLGRRFGAYEAVAELGRGGMAAVLLGDRADGRYKGQVAIKVLQSALSRGDLAERFRAEGQILANLDHQNIARLLDAGDTEDGLSYLIMEHVDGPRIDTYADEHLLDVTARLRLFRSVLDGADYAHARGVVHRDLKPSNILVTSNGRPKIVDFGIAKLLRVDPSADPSVALTRTALRMMTPEYASPEQVLGKPVDPTSDVYSLGIVLYRLLTGRPPYGLPTTRPSDAEKVICEQAPRRPSNAFKGTSTTTVPGPTDNSTDTASDPDVVARARSSTRDRLLRTLRGDLDTIVLKALSKEPRRRYSTAGAFADDIDRYLDGRAIRARAPSAFYRASRFARRKRVPLAVAGVLIAGLATAAWQAGVAGSERQRARQSGVEITRLAESFLASLDRLRTEDQTSTAAREMVVISTIQSLDELVQRIDGIPDPALLMTLGRAYNVAGIVQGHPSGPHLGRPEEAVKSFGAAVDLFERVVQAEPDIPGGVGELARARILLGDMHVVLGARGEAAALTELALPVLDSLARANPDSIQMIVASAIAYERRATLRQLGGDLLSAAEDFARAIELGDQVPLDRLDEEARVRSLLNGIAARNLMATVLLLAGRLPEAVQVSQEAVRRIDSLAAASDPQPFTMAYQADTYYGLAMQLLQSDELDLAEEAFSRELEILKQLEQLDPDNAQTPHKMAFAYEWRGQTYIKAGKWGPALDDERVALDILTRLLAQAPTYAAELMQVRRQVGEALTGLGRFREAEAELVLAVEEAHEFAAGNPDIPAGPIATALAHSSLETLYQVRARESGSESVDCPRAVEMGDSANSIWDRARAAGSMNPFFEDAWDDFEARKSPGACSRFYPRIN